MKHGRGSEKDKRPPDELVKSAFVEAQEEINRLPPDQCGAHAPWKPGESGNPFGRPKSQLKIPKILRYIGSRPASPKAIDVLVRYFPYRAGEFRVMNNLEVMLWRAYLDAQYGDRHSREFISERTEGKVKEYVDLTSDDEPLGKLTQFDLSKLTSGTLQTLRSIVRDVLRKRSPAATPGDDAI